MNKFTVTQHDPDPVSNISWTVINNETNKDVLVCACKDACLFRDEEEFVLYYEDEFIKCKDSNEGFRFLYALNQESQSEQRSI